MNMQQKPPSIEDMKRQVEDMKNAPDAIPPAPAKKFEMTTHETGALKLQSVDEQLAFAKRLIDEKMVSSTFSNPAQVLIGFQYAKAMKMNEVLALKMMYVLNGRPCLYAEGPLALVQRLPSFKWIREYFIDKDGKEISPANGNLSAELFGAVTELMRVGADKPQVDYFTVEDMKTAGIDKGYQGKPKDVWVKWLRIMLRYKARTLALRSQFSDALAGIAIAEYDENFSPDLPEITDHIVSGRTNKAAEELNKAFLNDGVVDAETVPSVQEPTS